ncbi:putative ankyrin repeat protein [Paramyrothecium foliicola]|nr:putative ankyrin repeat protein [Paramyrothecium foliicola]
MSFGFSIGDFITVIKLANDIRKEFVGAPSQFENISDEVKSLSIVLQDADILLSECDADEHQKRNIKEITSNCHKVLIDIEETLSKYCELQSRDGNLGKRAKRTWRRLKWEPEDIRELRNRLTSNVVLLHTFINQMYRQGTFKSLKTLESQVNGLQRNADGQVYIVEANKKPKGRPELLDWISTLDYTHKHNTTCSNRVQGTGAWFLEHPEYGEWRRGLSQTNILWCPGIQETNANRQIRSAIIDDLTSLCGSGDTALAYTYFDYKLQDFQTATAVFSSILRQSLACLHEIPEFISNTYKQRSTFGPALAEKELQDLILSVLGSISVAYIIIDALDECAEAYLDSILSFLGQLRSNNKTRVLITSRQHLLVINECLKDDRQMPIEATSEDLTLYINRRLGSPTMKKRINKVLGQNIVDKLLEGARGMFLLAVLQLENILHEPTAGEIVDALSKLSGGLPEAFDNTIGRIHQQAPSRKRLGMSIIKWISYAKRKLTIFELSEALSVSPYRPNFDANYVPSADVILECCQGLVWIDTTTDEISFIHTAVQEYLDDFTADLFPNAEEDLGATCLRYIMLTDFKDGPKPDRCSITSLLEDYKFLPYAASFWGQHVRELEVRLDAKSCNHIKEVVGIQKILTDFFHPDRRNAAALSSQIREFSRKRRIHYWRPEEAYSVTPLHLAASFGLCHTLQSLLKPDKRADLNINQATKVIGSTPIILAASGGHVKAIQLLLEHGAQPGLRNWYGNALHCAAEAGQSTSVQLLIASGMGPNIRTEDGRLPLSCAMDHDEVATFETLARYGADTALLTDDRDDSNGSGYSILHEAVLMDCVGIVNLILRNRWLDAEIKTHWGQTPVHLAACRPHSAILKRLLETGADVNVKDDFGNTPLFYAQKVEADDSVAILLQKGAVAETNEVVAMFEPFDTAATSAASGEEDLPAIRSVAIAPSVSIFWGPLSLRLGARRVKQEIAREGFLPFAELGDPLFARRGPPLSNLGKYRPNPRNDREQIPIAKTVLYLATLVFFLAVGVLLLPSRAYNFLAYSFIIVGILGLLMANGLLYLKIKSWLRRRPANHHGKRNER